MTGKRKLDLKKYPGRTDMLTVAAVAISDKRAARRAYPARDLYLCDKYGNELGRISLWGHSVEIYMDPRIPVMVNETAYQFPEDPNEDNNDASIMRYAQAEKEKREKEGQHPEITDVLGITWRWDKESFAQGNVDTARKWPLAER